MVTKSQSCTVAPPPLVANVLPEGEYAKVLPKTSVLVMVYLRLARGISQMAMVRSSFIVANELPSGAKAMAKIGPECALMVARNSAFSGSQRRSVPS